MAKSATKPRARDLKEGQLHQALGSRGISTWATVAPAALTLVLGGAFLGRASLWTDEAATWVSSTQPVSNIIANSSHVDVIFLPYYLFMHFWLGASQSLWWMRLPSLVTGRPRPVGASLAPTDMVRAGGPPTRLKSPVRAVHDAGSSLHSRDDVCRPVDGRLG